MGIDNQAAYVMAANPTYSRRTRHVELHWHYVRDQVTKRTVDLWEVKTEDNPSDLMTKPLTYTKLEKLCTRIGLVLEPHLALGCKLKTLGTTGMGKEDEATGRTYLEGSKRDKANI